MILLSVLAFLAVFSVLVLVHEWGHFRAARWAGVRAEEFAIGFGPQILSWQRGETLFRLNLIPLGGYVKMTGEMAANADAPQDPRAFGAAKVWKRMIIAIAGVIMNWLLAIVVLSGLFAVGTTPVITDQADLATAIEMGQATVNDDNSVTLNEVQLPFGQAIAHGARETFRLTGVVVQKVAEIPTKIIETGALPDDLSGPIGIAQITHQVVPQGLGPILKLLAMLSISLAVMNLLPIPALDGGLLVFLAYEMITGRRPSPTVQGVLTYIGIGALLLLFLMITWQDIGRLIA